MHPIFTRKTIDFDILAEYTPKFDKNRYSVDINL
jgi:hypothetical protein